MTPLPVGREAAPGPRLVIGRSGARAGGPDGSIADAEGSIADAKIDALARAALDEGVSRTVTVGERAIFLEVVAPLVLVVVALRRRARYVGALGSRRTHAARIERLRAQGLDDPELARIHAPIGLDLGGRTAEDLALGILAEIVAELNRTKAR